MLVAEPVGQFWAQAMATTLLEANHAAHHARATGAGIRSLCPESDVSRSVSSGNSQ
jgi:hypothetical protein